ncbi:glutathione S-transferase family protein [Pseudomonas matsuisoli]|uniref:Glutathione S-transferase n=1 Tax=Pseudomonas matsuisoli TaxID=1515666 RepID=A0A917UR87_9PSED|nr:glutathione S-transferase [Pseudomonas matsuisoli]GGJ78992.1 glutathione S-transferase [Pseudomonas matsuisoli]
MLKIWGRKNSNNVRKVLWCAEEIGLPYERIDAGGVFGRVNEPGYLAMNPNGRVPVIEDGDLVLWESNAIVRYLAARYSPGELSPELPAERALADRWMDWTTSTLVPTFTPVFLGLIRTPPSERDNAAIKRGIEQCSEVLAIADAALAERPYLSGDTLGIGDIPLGALAYAWFEMPIVRPDLLNLRRWYDALRERDAYRLAVMTELT